MNLIIEIEREENRTKSQTLLVRDIAHQLVRRDSNMCSRNHRAWRRVVSFRLRLFLEKSFNFNRNSFVRKLILVCETIQNYKEWEETLLESEEGSQNCKSFLTLTFRLDYYFFSHIVFHFACIYPSRDLKIR